MESLRKFTVVGVAAGTEHTAVVTLSGSVRIPTVACIVPLSGAHSVSRSPWCTADVVRGGTSARGEPSERDGESFLLERLRSQAFPPKTDVDLFNFFVWQCYTFGRNNHGQLGLAGVKETRSPRLVSGLSSGASRGAGGVGRHVIKVGFFKPS